jgi:hypothetical protein
MKFTKQLLIFMAMVFATGAIAEPAAYNVCDKNSEVDRWGQRLISCSHTVPSKGATGRIKMDIEWTEPDGNTIVRSVNTTYVVLCTKNQLCGVEDSDTITTGSLMGRAPAGRYMLDYDYYLGVDVNNNPTEYLRNTGPAFGGKVAGSIVKTPPAHQTPSKVNGSKVVTASCAPQMDDDCTVNGKPVAMADLGKYLPKVDEADIKAAGGICEYPICYDSNEKPVGIRK